MTKTPKHRRALRDPVRGAGPDRPAPKIQARPESVKAKAEAKAETKTGVDHKAAGSGQTRRSKP